MVKPDISIKIDNSSVGFYGNQLDSNTVKAFKTEARNRREWAVAACDERNQDAMAKVLSEMIPKHKSKEVIKPKDVLVEESSQFCDPSKEPFQFEIDRRTLGLEQVRAGIIYMSRDESNVKTPNTLRIPIFDVHFQCSGTPAERVMDVQELRLSDAALLKVKQILEDPRKHLSLVDKARMALNKNFKTDLF